MNAPAAHVLPDFTRYAWVSERLRAEWEPRIKDATRAWLELEWLSVADGVRDCALTVLSQSEMLRVPNAAGAFGLSVVPIRGMPKSRSVYNNVHVEQPAGDFGGFLCALGPPQRAAALCEAWKSNDHRAIGSMLGYPACCCEFFSEVWQTSTDTTWEMAKQTSGAKRQGEEIELSGSPESNIGLRWLGIRLVPHLPCSFNCAGSIELGRRFAASGERHGFLNEIGVISEMLSWSLEWSALHGIAEIKTPVVKISTKTDETRSVRKVRRVGTLDPSFQVQGLSFPYRATPRPPEQPLVSVDEPQEVVETAEQLYHRDNGFSSFAGMVQLQRPLIERVAEIAAQDRDPDQSFNVIDFGCGNGALLRSICRRVEGARATGIERDGYKVKHGDHLLFDNRVTLLTGDILSDSDELLLEAYYEVAILMVGSLIENDQEATAQLRRVIRNRAKRVLVYAYPDYFAKREKIIRSLAPPILRYREAVRDSYDGLFICEAELVP